MQAERPLELAKRVARNPSLRRLEAAFIVFTSAEYGVWIALLVYAFDRGGARESGLVAVLALLPSVAGGLVAGGVGDRYARDRVLRAGYVAQAATSALVAVVVMLGAPAVVVYAAAFVNAPMWALTRPLQSTMLPSFVTTPTELTAANAVNGWAENVGVVLGPLVTGAVIGSVGIEGVFAGAAVVMAAAVLLVRPLRTSSSVSADEPDEAVSGASAFGALRHPGVTTLLAALTAQWIALGAVEILTVVLAFSVLGAGAGAVGLLDAAAGVGGILSVLVTLRLVGRPRLVPAMVVAAAGWGGVFVLIALQSRVLGAFVLLAAAGLLRSVFDVAGQTLLQRLAPPEVLARVFGMLEAFGMLGLAVGSLLVPVAVSLFGSRGAIVCVGATLPLLVMALLPWLRPVDAHANVPIVEIRLLKRVPMFAALPAPELEGVARSLIPQRIGAGTTFIVEGEAGHEMYVIADGYVGVLRGGQTVATLGPDEVVGEMALLNDVVRNASAVAASDVQLYVLAREPFLAAITRHVPAHDIASEVVRAREAERERFRPHV